MSKRALHAKSEAKSEASRANTELAGRQDSLGTHVCVQRDAAGLGVQPHARSLVQEVLNSPGEPLDAKTREFMEPRFGYDFSGVRVHTGEAAAESARAVSAKAYTAGSHIVFQGGSYSPSAAKDKHLMAHELTHVVQQSSGRVRGQPVAQGMSVSHPGDREENAARSVADQVSKTINGGLLETASDRKSVPASRPVGDGIQLQRQPYDDPSLSAQRSAEYAKGSLISGSITGGFSALFAGIGLIPAFQSAAAAKRQADIAQEALGVSKDQLKEAHEQNVIGREGLEFASRQAEAAEAQPTSVEGLSVQHATVPDFHADDKDKRRSDVTVSLLEIGVGNEDFARYRLRLQVDAKNQIRGGTTEEEDAQGYLGGFGGSNANLTFSATQIPSKPDRVRIQFRGVNVGARRRGVQRFHGEALVAALKKQNEKPAISARGGSQSKAAGPWAMAVEDKAQSSEPSPPPTSGKPPNKKPAGSKK